MVTRAKLVTMAPRSVHLSAAAAVIVADAVKALQGSEKQEDFAERMGVSAATIRRLTRGKEGNVQARSLESVSENAGWPHDALERAAEGKPLPVETDMEPSDSERLSRLERAFFRYQQDFDELRSDVQALLERDRRAR